MNRADRRMARTLPSGVLAVEINPTTRERLATLAAQRGCTIADLVRAAVDCGLDGMMDRATASWSGNLFGFTHDQGRTVRGNAAITADLERRTGSASFDDLESWPHRSHPGTAGDAALAGLLEELTQTRTIHPETELRMVYELPENK